MSTRMMSTGTYPLFIDVTVQRPVLGLSVGLCSPERHGKGSSMLAPVNAESNAVKRGPPTPAVSKEVAPFSGGVA